MGNFLNQCKGRLPMVSRLVVQFKRSRLVDGPSFSGKCGPIVILRGLRNFFGAALSNASRLMT